ncbi:interferon-induced very large GTPase 1-like [Lithobates pipiens]
MSSTEEASQTIRNLKHKLIFIFEKNVYGLYEVLESLDLLSLDEVLDLFNENIPFKSGKMIDIILQKGESSSKKFLDHLQVMITRFPALSSLPLYHKEEKKSEFQELVEQLNMKKYLTSKVTLSDVLSIGSEDLKDVELRNINEIPWYFLRNLMALNRSSRSTQLKKDPTSQEDNDDDNDDVDGDDNDDMFDVLKVAHDTSSTIHPLDALCVLLHCSDSFLQQEIATKMSMCQFAVPLLLPPVGDGSRCTFLLWAMRGIVKKWRPHSLLDSKGFREENVVNIPMPTVSFVRLGENKLSKSKTLNQILNPAQQQHNFFIYHEMEGGNIKRKISDGLVEVSWYFPCDNSDVFQEPISVTNLRGDLESSWNQFMFLTRVSSAVFIFVEDICENQVRLLSTCNNTDTEFYFIVTPGPGKEINQETKNCLKQLMETLHVSKKQLIIKRNKINDAAFVKKIQSILKNLIHKERQQPSLESMKTQTNGLKIDVDENFPDCQKARACACVITSTIGDVEGYKKETLKLQGDLWKQLSKVEKELCRMINQGNKDAQQYRNELEQKRIALHKKQHEHDLPNPIMLFVTAITHLSQVQKQYFLKWMKLELDTIARKNLTALQVEYKEKCKSKSNSSGELKEVDQKISDSSLGIEHFIRELGQFYEAECSMVKEEIIPAERAQFTELPKIAADLLLDGFPLELIDGDASNIPMKWITDVLTELSNKTEMKSQIRVITVLGVQSTGKSTLLNTMFGLQFPVASGRCTRGAFMTLLKVKKDFEVQLGCKFIIVIDTEGLKAPELASLEDSYEHDNELATLVVGLSDITIVNMAMENSTEMKDILQIVVHAFLRMKEVGRKPNCQFVHQNVSDVSAHEKNMRDRKKLLEQLDEMTKVAAKMEKQDGITSFSDVIDYDLEKHSWYIPGLWQGVPPMAPVNSGYSENVLKLKKYLFEFMKTQNSAYSINGFITWIESLWKGVKHEKFIFSFKNSLVAEAYNNLSMQFSLWEWEFGKKVYNFVTSTENNIKNQSAESLEMHVSEQYTKELHQLVFEEENKMLDLLDKYFDSKSGNVHLIERYREEFRMSVQFLRRELERNALNKCNKAISIQKGKFEIQNIQSQYQLLIEKKISSLLETGKKNKSKFSSTKVEQEFESMWKKTLKDLKIKKLERHDIDHLILQQLRHDLSNRGPAVHEKLKGINSLQDYGQQTFKMDQKYIDHSWWDRVRNKLGIESQTFESVENFAVSLIDMCNKYVKEKADTPEDYDDTYSQELLYKINKELESTANLHTSRELELDIKLITLRNAAQRFQQLHDTFIKNNDPTQCLESLRPQYLSVFLSIFQEKGERQNRAKQFCERCIKPAITNYVYKHLGEKIVDDILHSSENIIFSSRSFFQCKMLEKLLEEMSFQKYVEYILSYEKFSESWILSYITKKYKSSAKLNHLCKILVSSITMEIDTVLKDKACIEMPTISSFLEKVCDMLQKELVIPQNEMKVVTFHNTTAVEQFSSDIQHFLTLTEEQILTELGSLDIESVLSKVTLKPQDELFRKVIGCGKQCPFCKVPCEAGGGEHTHHFASIHRSTGLGQYRWHGDDTLITDICTTLVVSTNNFKNSDTEGKWHPYKEYRTYYPDWAIQPDPGIECSDYWKFIFVLFNQQFAEEYKAKPAKLPEDWEKITEVQALNNVMQVFNMD